MSQAKSGDTVKIHYTGTHADGQVMNLLVTEVEKESIMVDGNHPLAGQALTFAIELVEIA